MTTQAQNESDKYGLKDGKHGVVIVHGIGEQKKGETIADFANSLALTLIESKGPAHVDVNADLDSSPAMVTLSIKKPNSNDTVEWICKEAYWADAFQPPSAREVIKLVVFKHFRVIFKRLLGLMTSLGIVIRDPFNNIYGMGLDGTDIKASDEKFKIRDDSFPGFLASTGHLLIAAILPFAGALGYTLLLVYWLIGWAAGVSSLMPVLKPVDSVVGWLHKNVDPFLSKSIGDLSQYFEHTVWSASIRHRLESIVVDMLKDKSITDVTVVAHSMGCLVSYEVLSKGEEVAAAVAELKKAGQSKKITFVSFGSAINLSFDMVRQPNVSLEAKERIDEPYAPEITGHIPGQPSEPKIFHWMDIHSRLDPVPAGFPSKIVLAKNEVLTPEQVEPRKVVNMDDLFQDHSAYWHNREQVMVRIAKAINGGKYPWASLEPTREVIVKRVRSASTWVIFRGIAVLLAITAGIIFRPEWLLITLITVLGVDFITLVVARIVSRY